MAQEEIKIRSLPRGNEKASQTEKPDPKAKAKDAKVPRWIIYVGTASALALVTLFALPKPKSSPGAVSRAPVAMPVQEDAAVDRYLQDAQLKQQMMVRKRELENMQFKSALKTSEPDAEDFLALPEGERNLGVQMDADNSAERVFEDLNDAAINDGESLPAERINSRLANRRWVNELERRERIQFVTNFIRSAYDRGLEVEIDQNLVVVGVRKINQTRKVNINQVIDRLAKQGL
jgi:hypothetical protein